MSKLKRRFTFLHFNLALIFLIPISVFFFDKPVSVFISKYLSLLAPFFLNFTFQFDFFSFWILKILICIFCIGILSLFIFKNKLIGIAFLSILITHLSATAITNVLKSEVKRARPQETINQVTFNNSNFAKSNNDYSFPSAHTSFYLSLFLPIALVFRRYAVVILGIPIIIILGRIILNLHFLSDVLCSILIVNILSYSSICCLVWLFNKLFKKSNFNIEFKL